MRWWHNPGLNGSFWAFGAHALCLGAVCGGAATLLGDSPPAASAEAPPAAVAPSWIDYPVESQYWPERVANLREVTIPHGGGSVRLPAGREHILIRIEADRVVADTGRYGVLELPWEDTDVRERVRQIAAGQVVKEGPLLVRQLPGKVMMPAAEGDWQPISLTALEKVRRIVFYYDTEGSAPANPALTGLQDWYGSVSAQGEVLVVYVGGAPTVEAMAETMRDRGVRLPFLPFSFARGYTQAFHHLPEPRPALVVVDPEGRILAHSHRGQAPPDLAAVLRFLHENRAN